MDFELSEEQLMLRDSVDRFVRANYEFSQRQAGGDDPAGYSAEHWKTFAEMGWLALPFAEDNGGMGGTVPDSALLLGELGKGLVREPFLSSVLLGGRLIEEAGTPEQKERLLPLLMGGEATFAVALHEPQARYDLAHVRTQAASGQDGHRLTGHKNVVAHAVSATHLLIVARSSGEPRDAAGLSLFLVEADAPGLRRQDYRLADGQPASDLWLEDVPAELLGDAEGAVFPALRKVMDEAICAACGDAAGVMEAVFDLTRDYVGTRSQFGRSIGDNQVIQHRLADMFGALEEAKSLVEMTAMRLAARDDRASEYVAGTAAKVFTSARFVGEQGIQLHGGIGMTDAYPAGHYYKRLLTLEGLFGSAAHHLGRYAESI